MIMITGEDEDLQLIVLMITVMLTVILLVITVITVHNNKESK